ncbi:MAG: molybdenum cofactor guanylyltransferase [Halobacteriaceae archaeon]
MRDVTRTGVVLAGGRATRFGDADKAVVALDGTPLVARVADRLAPVVDELVVNCRREQASAIRSALGPRDYRIATDPVPDRGPVAGLRTGLRVARGWTAAVAACDLPALDPAFLDSLFADARGESGVVPVVEGHRQPLAAVYRVVPTVEACDATMATGARSLRAMLDHLDPREVPEATVRERTAPATFCNVNRREDLMRARRAVGLTAARPSNHNTLARARAPSAYVTRTARGDGE